MKHRAFLILLSIMLAPIQDGFAQPVSAPSSTAPISANAQANIQQNGEIIAWLIAVNSTEIATAKVALSKHPNSAIQQYANMMVEDHSKNLDETLALSKDLNIKPLNNTDLFNLLKKGMTENAQLAMTPDVDFPKKYIEAMVKGHTEVLAKINEYLTDSGINPRLQDHLKTTRTTVEKHLEEAKSIQASLDKSVQT